MKKTLPAIGVTLLLAASIAHAELVQQFKDPTFSGQNWASHVLTLEQMRQGAQNSKDAKEAAAQAQINSEAANTPLSKFMNLFTGQVYSQLATQLTNNLFKECTSGSCSSGDFNVSSTQQIHWEKAGGQVTLSVFTGKLGSDGVTFTKSSTTPDQMIVVPISSFSF